MKSQHFDAIYEEEQKSLKNRPKNAEELVVPALKLTAPIDFNTVGEDQYDGAGGQGLLKPEDEELKLEHIGSL